MERFTCVAGSDFITRVALVGVDGRDVTTYTGADTLTLKLSYGDTRAPVTLTTSAASWVDASLGQVQIWVKAADTAGLTAGDYFITIAITSGSVVANPGPLAILRIIAAPGAATAPTTYCSLDDMRRFAPWIDRLRQDDMASQSDFAELRARARTWLDEQIVARARAKIERQSEWHEPLSPTDPITVAAGYDRGPCHGPSIYAETTIRDQVATVQTALDDDGLIVDERVRELTAKYAIYLACDVQVGNGPGDTPYQVIAAKFHRDCVRGLVGWIARIDTDDDDDIDMEI